jgi:alginate O-acetyltransferase complex protein AlgI
VILGVSLLVLAANATVLHPLVRGWLGMVGIISLLHFGLFEIQALSWRARGVAVDSLMCRPLAATSLADFWSRRWNTAFNRLARDFAFRPLARRFDVPFATLATFFASGLVHDAIISIPARGGYGLPTLYFVLQGLGVLLERSRLGENAGLGRGMRGRLFTIAVVAGPAFWLFHPPFVRNVILPMLDLIRSN